MLNSSVRMVLSQNACTPMRATSTRSPACPAGRPSPPANEAPNTSNASRNTTARCRLPSRRRPCCCPSMKGRPSSMAVNAQPVPPSARLQIRTRPTTSGQRRRRPKNRKRASTSQLASHDTVVATPAAAEASCRSASSEAPSVVTTPATSTRQAAAPPVVSGRPLMLLSRGRGRHGLHRMPCSALYAAQLALRCSKAARSSQRRNGLWLRSCPMVEAGMSPSPP